MSKCSVEGCVKESLPGRRNMCGAHYQKWHKYGDPLESHLPQPNNGACSVDGCTRPPRSNASPYCEMHYYRLRRNGSLDTVLDMTVSSNCMHCGKRLTGKETKCCSDRCRARYYRNNPLTATCVECGKEFIPVMGAESCSDECNKSHTRTIRNTWHYIRQNTERACKQCGRGFTPERGKYRRYCSDECEREWRRISSAAKIPQIEQPCRECGAMVVHGYRRRRWVFCSRHCLRKYGHRISRSTRGAQMRGASEIEQFDPRYILKRDGWRCYICGCATPEKLRGTKQPNAPEVDHVVPLAKGGTHTEQNVRCICRSCNSKKGAKLLDEIDMAVSVQLRLL